MFGVPYHFLAVHFPLVLVLMALFYDLRGIFEELITPILYVIPDDPSIQKVTITSLFADPMLERRAKS